MGNLLNNTNIALLEKGLDAVWMRQKVIANNIANAATPGYKSKSLEFEDLLSQQIGKEDLNDAELREAIDKVDPTIVENNTTSAREDGNNVNLDKENIELARAQIQYSYLVNSLNAQISRLKYVINEGRG